MFREPDFLEPLYDEIIRTAIFTVKPDNIGTFRVEREANHRDSTSSIQKSSLKISSFDDHSSGRQGKNVRQHLPGVTASARKSLPQV